RPESSLARRLSRFIPDKSSARAFLIQVCTVLLETCSVAAILSCGRRSKNRYAIASRFSGASILISSFKREVREAELWITLLGATMNLQHSAAMSEKKASFEAPLFLNRFATFIVTTAR